jgi:hypothetical protein
MRAMWPAQTLPKLPEGTQKLTCWPSFSRSREVSLEVVDHLGGDAAPVDGVDRADAIFRFEFKVIGNILHNVLAVVEHPAHGDVEDVGVPQAVHLGLLEGGHAVLRREHEHPHVVLAAHGVFGGGAGVAGGGAEDVDVLVGLVQGVLEQVAQELHGHVLEGQGGAVGQFQDVEAAVCITLELAQGGDLAEVRIRTAVAVGFDRVGLVHQGLEVGGGDIVGESGQDGEGQLPVVHVPHGRQVGGAEMRVGLGQIQATVRRQAAQQDFREVQGGGLAPGADVFHGGFRVVYSPLPRAGEG